MYIAPSSTITLYRGVPLTTSYQDTIYFDSVAQQQSYFNSVLEKRTFNDQMYQRKDKNICRVEINAEQIYSYNYMSFRNDAFGDKVFYAFITNVEYLNNRVSEITYEIDIMQTWALDYRLGQCYVIREHSNTDEVGEHILAEPIDANETIAVTSVSGGFSDLSIVLLYAESGEGQIAPFGLRDGIFTQCEAFIAPFSQAGAVRVQEEIKRIMKLPGGLNNIISVYMAPTVFATRQSGHTGNLPYTESKSITKPNTIGGFVPNNKKLLTFPYTYLMVDTLNDNKVYRWENFNGPTASFRITGVAIGTPTVICAPNNYEVGGVNYSEQVVMGGYPQGCVAVDAFKQWLSTSGISTLLTGVASVGAIASGNPVGIGAGIIGVARTINEVEVQAHKANSARGAVSCYVNAQNRSKDLYFRVVELKPEKARSVDDFFSRYGYACERVKIPNRKARKRWTYTKTAGCVVKGNVPADDLARISEIFDNGITFWTTAGEVGDYIMSDNGVL